MRIKKFLPLFLVIISFLLVLGCALQTGTTSKNSDESAQITVNDQDSGISMCFIPASYKDAIGIKMADSIMAAYPSALDYDINIGKKGWEYTNGVLFYGFERLAQMTKQNKYLDFVKPYVDYYVKPDGTIQYLMAYGGTSTRDTRIQDVIQPSRLMFSLYTHYRTANNYKIAMTNTSYDFPGIIQPTGITVPTIQTNSLGGFFHKPTYQYQMWLDGTYMSEPFIAKFGATYADKTDRNTCFDTAVKQLTLIAEKTWDPTIGLYKHAWLDWAGLKAFNLANPTAKITAPAWTKDPSTDTTSNGTSPAVWSRGLGWYSMAVVDVLDNIPRHHKGYRELVGVMNNLAKGLAKYQAADGLWYQVVNKDNISLANNFEETSGSAMFIYALEKAARHGYISGKYLKTAAKGWQGLKTYVVFNATGVLSNDKTDFILKNVVAGMSPLTTEAAYAAVAKVDPTQPNTFNVPQGIAAVLLASSAMEFNHRDFYHW